MSDETSQVEYQVVINDEEQYSIWLVSKELPDGWASVGVDGTKDHCLSHIESVWLDMRPRSLRVAMAEGSEEGS